MEVSNYLEPISKQEMELLIEHDILKLVQGKYVGLTVTNKNKKGSYKQRQVEEPLFWALQSLKHKLKKQEQQKVDK